ncbi:MAG: sugar ABC transporter permease [Anaerolineales bacterium]|nr:sugar ABC transporter permease [Anaerolineales bacterium]
MKASIQLEAADRRTVILLRAAVIWHIVLAIAGLAGGLLVWLRAGDMLLWLRLPLGALLVLTAAASSLTALFVQRGRHSGRVLSLAVNYLGFLFCFLGGMHVLGMFTGIDSLASTFGRGIPYLGGVLAGYLISALGDRYENHPERRQMLKRVGKVVMLAFMATFLLAIGTLSGLLAVVRRFTSFLPCLLVGGGLLFGLMIWALWRRDSAVALGASTAHEQMLNGFLFLSPNLLGFLLFFAGPLLLSLYFSFTNYDATTHVSDWVGLQNYARLFNLTIAPLTTPDQPVTEALDMTVYDELMRFNFFERSFILGAQDKLFWIALRNTIVFCLLAVPLSVIPALFLANLLNSKLPGMKFFRAIYFLPSVAAVVGVALIWQWLYNAAVGYINYSITSAVTTINTLFGSAILDPQIRWLSDTRIALLAVVIMSAWQWIGFDTVLFMAGMQAIPRELYEAATVDGAGRWAQFRRITIPLLGPTTFFVVTTAVINALQLFEQVYVLINTEPPGGPANSTLSLVLYLYVRGFQRFQQGYASAVAWVLFIVIFGVTLLQYRRQRSGAYA